MSRYSPSVLPRASGGLVLAQALANAGQTFAAGMRARQQREDEQAYRSSVLGLDQERLGLAKDQAAAEAARYDAGLGRERALDAMNGLVYQGPAALTLPAMGGGSPALTTVPGPGAFPPTAARGMGYATLPAGGGGGGFALPLSVPVPAAGAPEPVQELGGGYYLYPDRTPAARAEALRAARVRALAGQLAAAGAGAASGAVAMDPSLAGTLLARPAQPLDPVTARLRSAQTAQALAEAARNRMLAAAGPAGDPEALRGLNTAVDDARAAEGMARTAAAAAGRAAAPALAAQAFYDRQAARPGVSPNTLAALAPTAADSALLRNAATADSAQAQASRQAQFIANRRNALLGLPLTLPPTQAGEQPADRYDRLLEYGWTPADAQQRVIEENGGVDPRSATPGAPR